MFSLFFEALLAFPYMTILRARSGPHSEGFNDSPLLSNMSDPSNTLLIKRQPPPPTTICGYLTGDPNKIRSAAPGFACRVDTQNQIWGFCPTSVIAAIDCGLFAACYDDNLCKNGCGKVDTPGLTTQSCTESGARFCSIVLSLGGIDQTWSNVACGRTAAVETLFPSPTAVSVAPTTVVVTSIKTTEPPRPSPTPVAPPSSTSATLRTSSSQTSTINALTSASSLTQTRSVLTSQTIISQVQSTILGSSSAPESSLASPPANLGAIIGGALGGLALICATILGVFYLRKYRRKQSSGQIDTLPSTETKEYKTTEMQVAGLHEKDSDGVMLEKDGRMLDYEKKHSYWRDSRRGAYEMEG